ncbi:MAG: 2OG-Fe(II) oxygenase [Synechococcales bacterium]|nr:2OG-Fe(II) oxygenase [Synechococcales bacterium]
MPWHVNILRSTVTHTAPYVIVPSLLPPTEWLRLLAYVAQQEANFVPTSTMTGELDYRKSWVLYDFPEWRDRLVETVQILLPQVLQRLGLEPFVPEQVEIQLTAHNHGNYYKIHNDNGNEEVARRVISYVYYFHRTPKPYQGGELKLYDLVDQDGMYQAGEQGITIAPPNNSLVLFPSYIMHEVLPVDCPSGNFLDSRFTLNGWVRRSDRP